MSDIQPSSLSLDIVARGFKLTRTDERGHKSEMFLSEDNVISLAQSAERWRDHIVAKHTQRAGSAHPVVVVTLVGAIELNSDIHNSHLKMTLVDQNGGRSPSFAMAADVVQGLYTALPEWLAILGSKKPQH